MNVKRTALGVMVALGLAAGSFGAAYASEAPPTGGQPTTVQQGAGPQGVPVGPANPQPTPGGQQRSNLNLSKSDCCRYPN